MFTSISAPIRMERGAILPVDGKTYLVRELCNPAARPSRFPFTYQSYDYPAARALRRQYDLEKVIAPGRTDLERGVRLMDWLHRAAFTPRFKALRLKATEEHPDRERNKTLYGWALPLGDMTAAKVIENAGLGQHTIYCSHAAMALIECAGAVGLVMRKINIDGHGVVDCWCHELRKWIVFDPHYSYHYVKGEEPLSAADLRQEFFRNRGKDVRKVMGVWEKTVRWSTPPDVVSLTPLAYEWFAIMTRNDFLTNPVNINDYWDNSRMLVLRDSHNKGKRWLLKRGVPKPTPHEGYRGKFLFSTNPDDLFWDVGISELRAMKRPLTGRPGKDELRVTVAGFTPDLNRREIRIDDGAWRPLDGSFQFFDWHLHPGRNTARARAVHTCGRTGPESSIVLQSKG